MKEPKKVLALTHKITVTDRFENRVKKEIIELILDQETFTVLNSHDINPDKKLSIAEKYFLGIDKVAFRLLQCHKHQTNYKIVESQRIKELNMDIRKINRCIDECWRPLELNCEIDAFLTKWKSTLDALAKILIPLYEINSKTWGDKGQKIINQLNNNTSSGSINTQQLIKLIQDNKSRISSIIDLRDKVVHYDIECLTSFHYSHEEKKLYTPDLKWDNKIYNPHDFMTQTSEYLLDFIREFIIISINCFIEPLHIVITGNGHDWFLPSNN